MSLGRRRVLVVGAGGLGCPVAVGLAAAGIPFSIIDDDVVDDTNLGRQMLFTEADVGRPKVEAVADALARRFPSVSLTPLQGRLDASSGALIASHSLVVDGSDNFPTRFLVNELCVEARVPFVHGAALGWSGQVLSVVPGKSACLRCVFESEPPAGSAPTCAEAGVIAPLVGQIGALMVEAARALYEGSETDTLDAMRIVDARTGRTRLAGLGRDPECATCSALEKTRSPAVVLDVSSERCPMTWVRTKLALEKTSPGEVVEVHLGPGEMLQNIPRNARDDGHEVTEPESIGPDRHRVLIRRRA